MKKTLIYIALSVFIIAILVFFVETPKRIYDKAETDLKFDFRKIANKTPEEVEEVLGEPTFKGTTKVYGIVCPNGGCLDYMYEHNGVEISITYINGVSDFIVYYKGAKEYILPDEYLSFDDFGTYLLLKVNSELGQPTPPKGRIQRTQ